MILDQKCRLHGKQNILSLQPGDGSWKLWLINPRDRGTTSHRARELWVCGHRCMWFGIFFKLHLGCSRVSSHKSLCRTLSFLLLLHLA